MLIIDDCLQQVVDGIVPIMELITNGRTMGLTVVCLFQGGVRASTYGKIVRSNANVIIFLHRMLNEVAETKEWVSSYEKRDSPALPRGLCTSVQQVCYCQGETPR